MRIKNFAKSEYTSKKDYEAQIEPFKKILKLLEIQNKDIGWVEEGRGRPYPLFIVTKNEQAYNKLKNYFLLLNYEHISDDPYFWVRLIDKPFEENEDEISEI